MVRVFKMAGIVNQTVDTGRTLSFRLTSELGEGASFSCTTKPKPAGDIVLDAESGLFSYTPRGGFPHQFSITFQATKGAEKEERTIRITPRPHLPSDFDIITNSARQPDPSSLTYTHETDRVLSPLPKRFNPTSDKSAAVNTREVVISGVQLVFEKDSASHTLLKSYAGQTNIERFTLYCDEVIIRHPLVLPSTNVTIHARALVFEGDGRIVTTPVAFHGESGEDPALDGGRGGDIELHVKSIEAPGTKVRFITRGGGGQSARRGEAGTKGRSVLAVWDGTFHRDMHWFNPELDLNWTGKMDALKGHSAVYVEIIKTMGMSSGWSGGPNGHKVPKYELTEKVDTWGDPDVWPTSGKDPKVKPGRPGEGGAGGDVHRPEVISLPETWLDVGGGEAGQMADDIDTATAGTPVKACHAKAYFKPSGGVQRTVDRLEMVEPGKTTYDGASGTAPEPRSPRGAAGQVESLDARAAGYWLTPVAAKAFVEYAKDVYLAEKPHLVRDTLAEYQAALRDPPRDSNDSIDFAALLVEVSGLIRRMDGQYDYFGNPAGWVPMLSFESNLKLYRNEVESSARLLFLGYWIEKNQESGDRLVDGLNVTVTRLDMETEAAIADYSAAQKELADVDLQYRNLEVDIQDRLQELESLEKRLREKARGDLQRERILRGSAKLLGGVLQMIPAGQPALGAVGTTLSVLADFDPEEPFSTVKNLGSELWGTQLLQEKLLPSVKASASSFLKLDTGAKKDLTDFDKAKAKKELENSVKKAIDEEKEVKEQVTKALGSFTVPDEELEEATRRAVADSPEYAEIAAKAEALGEKKKRFAQRLYSIMHVLDTATDTILNNELGKIEVREQLTRALQGLNHEARRHAGEMQRNARARLVKYQYYLVKSYNYLMLTPRADVDYRASYMLDAFADLLGKSEDGTLNDPQYNAVLKSFESELRKMTGTIVDAYARGARSERISVGVSLTPRQLEALNRGGSQGQLTLNLMDMGYLPATDDDLRIIEIRATDATLIDPPSNKAVNVRLEYRHSGTSVLRNNGRQFLFRTGDYSLPTGDEDAPARGEGQNKRMWGSMIKLSADGVKDIGDITPSPAEESLLNYLMKPEEGTGEAKTSDARTSVAHYRPSGRGDISVRRTSIPETYPGQLGSLSLTVTYDYRYVDDHIRTVNVQCPGGARPFIKCDTADMNQRSHGVGNFLRIYNSEHVGEVALTAPAFFGDMKFMGWKLLADIESGQGSDTLPPTPLMEPEGVETFLDLNDRFVNDATDSSFNSWMRGLKKARKLTLELNRNHTVLAIYLPTVG